MSKVALVSDSTVNISSELLQQNHIAIAPLQVIWGPKTYLDGVDIQPQEFYTRLADSKVMPSTSQPTPAAFIDIYQTLLDQGYDILSVHISSKLSGTISSAEQARQHFPGAKIEVVDSGTTATAMGFPVLLAAQAALQGESLAECKQLVERGCAQSGIFFAVSTLEFLRRGGRIGGAAAFLGTALNLKPILELKDGRIEAVERVRTMSKTIDRLLDLFVGKVGDRRPVYIGSLHANAEAEGKLLLQRALERFNPNDVRMSMLSPISPVLGTHVGPGTMGLAFMAGI